MTIDHRVVVDHDERAQRFSATVEGKIAILDYQRSGQVMSIMHTGVPPSIGGRGIAAALMEAALAAAKTAGWQINPVCSYAAAYVQRHPVDHGTPTAKPQ